MSGRVEAPAGCGGVEGFDLEVVLDGLDVGAVPALELQVLLRAEPRHPGSATPSLPPYCQPRCPGRTNHTILCHGA